MEHSTHIEISKSALYNNLSFIKKLLGSKTAFSSVIKGNAYGHGVENIVPLEEEFGVSHFSVFNADEALKVFQASNGSSTIMIMGMLLPEQIEWAIENDVEFVAFDIGRVKTALQYAEKIKKKAKIHIEIETGMNRTGLERKNIPRICKLIQDNKNYVEIKGVCTHFAGAESIANYYRVKKQEKAYQSALKKMEECGIVPEKRHVACSAAAIKYPKTKMDMARIGILQYGFFPTREIMISYLSHSKTNINPLKRIITWKSKVMGKKSIKQGEFVGYGNSFFANSTMEIAIVPIGYSQGYSRSLSNQGRVLIGGHFAHIVGVVNMSMILVDITNIANVQLGDEVVLIGKQGEHEISVASFSDFTNQVNYELLTRLPVDIPRIVTE